VSGLEALFDPEKPQEVVTKPARADVMTKNDLFDRNANIKGHPSFCRDMVDVPLTRLWRRQLYNLRDTVLDD
jgi:hypothetical protein